MTYQGFWREVEVEVPECSCGRAGGGIEWPARRESEASEEQ